MQASTQSSYSISTWDSGKNQSQKINRGTRVFRGALVGPAGGSAALGTLAKTRKRFQDQKEKKRAYTGLYTRLRIARELLPKSRVAGCMMSLIPSEFFQGGKKIETKSAARVKILQKGESHFFGGLHRCKNVWDCPSCARTITTGRGEELLSACKNARDKGYDFAMLTLTIPHYRNHALKLVLDRISKALRTLKNRKGWKNYVKVSGYLGDIRTLEVKFGKANGWHPHFHILIFSQNEIDAEFLTNLVSCEWKKVCIDLDIPEPNQHGVDVQRGDEAMAQYISKWGHEPTEKLWDIDAEMTKGHTLKSSNTEHLTPFGLLDAYGDNDASGNSINAWAGEKFKEFSAAFRGKRQLVWTRGLKKLLGIVDKTDEEIINEAEEETEVFAEISLNDYMMLVHLKKEGDALYHCSYGLESFLKWLQNLKDKMGQFNFGKNKLMH